MSWRLLCPCLHLVLLIGKAVFIFSFFEISSQGAYFLILESPEDVATNDLVILILPQLRNL